MSHSQVNISLFSLSFYLEDFNADVAIMMKMWVIATSYQGGRGLASFVGTMNSCAEVDNDIIYACVSQLIDYAATFSL